MNYIEFLHNRDKYLGENHDDFLMHYGVLGQKWGQRHWQNPDGTYTTEGKIRYFGSKKAQAEINADETKIGSKKSDVKDYLKFRNKMLKERTRSDLNEWYRDKNKYLDKQLVRDAKRVDKQQEKMYKNQLKEWYDNPEDLVADLNAMYKIGGSGDAKVGSLYTTGQKIKELLTNNKEINENGQEYDRRYQWPDGSLATRGYELSEKQRLKKINTDMLEDYKNKESERREAERIEKEKKDAEVRERVQKLDNEIITDKYPKSTNGLTDEEFETIANDLDKWKQDFYDGKTDKHLNTLVADLGINALNKARGYGEAEVGNNNDREWFMYEDQTLGNPEIAYLYVKGYSKDYIKGMLDHKIEIDSDEEYDKLYDKHPTTMFTKDEYHDGDQYIDALFELKEGSDQKIGGWNLSKNNKQYYKELKSTVKELGLDKDGWDLDKKNGVLTKDFKDKDNKHNIGLFATTDKENMKKLTDKINKNYSKDNISKIFDDIREKAAEKAYKKYVKDYKEWDLEDEILSREDFKNSIIIPKSIIFNDEGKTDTLYFELPYKPGTNWFIESYWTGDLDVDGNLSKLKFEWN